MILIAFFFSIFEEKSSVETGRKLNVDKTFNLRPVSTGLYLNLQTIFTY